jgi:muconate cycloisomerase
MFRIARIDAFAVSVPMTMTMKLAGHTISSADSLIVRITDRDGTVGWGEAASAPTMTGETPEGMVAAARFMASRLEGVDVGELAGWDKLPHHVMYGNDGGKAAIEMALLDLAGKRLGKPLYEMLGGKIRRDAVILTMVAGGGSGSEIDNAKAQARAGFVAFKVKVGVDEPAKDLARARAVRDALGPKVRISADANQGYGRQDAISFARGAQGAGLDFMEQLVAATDLEGMAACAASSAVPLGADEGFHSLADIERHHRRRAAAGGSLKPIKLGGLMAVLDAARLMDRLGMQVNLAGKIAETSIASAAIAHLAHVVPKLDWDVSVTNQYLAEDVTEEPIRIVEGRVCAPDRPGLGVTPSEAKLAKFKLPL